MWNGSASYRVSEDNELVYVPQVVKLVQIKFKVKFGWTRSFFWEGAIFSVAKVELYNFDAMLNSWRFCHMSITWIQFNWEDTVEICEHFNSKWVSDHFSSKRRKYKFKRPHKPLTLSFLSFCINELASISSSICSLSLLGFFFLKQIMFNSSSRYKETDKKFQSLQLHYIRSKKK